MTLGTFGSTLNDELNRLANGGTYRDMDDMVDEALAAKQWANREYITPYSTDTVGVLNEIAGLGTNRQNWLDFNGVCNYIAGTTGLPAAAALRQVYATTDLLTGVASYYVDATDAQVSGGYLFLPGTVGNYASTPDSAAISITGDIDLRVKVALTSWNTATNASPVRLIAKRNTDWSYELYLAADNKIYLSWSTNGSSGTELSSTEGFNFLNGTTNWIRATLDVDNGASGKTATFFTSNDGTTWTQLGTPVTTAGTTSIFNGTSILEIGSNFAGTVSNARGKFFRAQVLNGIGGTTVFDANFETAMTSQTVTSFTESSSNAATVTVNRTTYNFQLDTINNLGAAGSLLPTTLGSSTAADSNDPKFLAHTGTNYVYTPGVNGNYLSVPDSAALDITGDIDLRVQVAMDDWTPASGTTLLSKWAASNQSFAFNVNAGGLLVLYWTTNGSTVNTATSSVGNTITDGTVKWVRATLDVDNGASGNDVRFFTSDDGTTWAQLGSTITTAGVTSIFSGTALGEVGSNTNGTSSPLPGKIFRAQIYDGIDGTTVLDVDTSVITAGSATSFTAVTGQTVTINRSTSGRKTVAVTQPTWLFGTDDYMEVNNRYMAHSGTNYLYYPQVNGNSCTAINSAAFQITGDIDIRCKVAMDDWTPASGGGSFINRDFGAPNRGYVFYLTAAGGLVLGWSTTGSNFIERTSTVANTITDGSVKWVRATLDVDNGASGHDVAFYTSDDGTTWTQLGTTITTAGTTSIFASTSPTGIGGNPNNNSTMRGKFFRAQVLNGIDGTVAFDANFETSITSLLQTSFTESSANAATVTINRSGSAYRSAGITAAGYLYPGATNTFSASATDFLNFGAADSFTIIAVSRQWATATSLGVFVAKRTATGYALQNHVNAGEARFLINDGTFAPASITAYDYGSLNTVRGIRNVSTDTLTIVTNKATASASDTTTGSITTLIDNLLIGRDSPGNYNNMELYAVAVFRTLLSTRQLSQIVNYFARREAYL